MKRFLAVDVSEKNIKYGLFNEYAMLLSKKSMLLPTNKNEYVNQILKIYNEYVGICAISFCISKDVNTISSLKFLKDVNYDQEFMGLTSIKIESNYNCAILAEVIFGDQVNSIILLDIDNKISGSIVNDKKITYNNLSDEFGNTILNYKTMQTWSDLASKSSLIKKAMLYLNKKLTCLEVLNLADTDKIINEYVQEFYKYNAIGICSIKKKYNPEKIILMGEDYESTKILEGIKFYSENIDSSYYSYDTNLYGALASYFNNNVVEYKFNENFLWGAATSGIQSEGTKDMKNLSTWSKWYDQSPEVFNSNIGPNKVCNTYEKYKEDIMLMKDVKMNSFRTSIQWSRLIDDFECASINQKGYDFYNNYFDSLIKSDITPVINLYHFDMPEILQTKYGGFESKHVVKLFVLYAKKVFELFGDKIKYFTTFNEPIVPVEGGYLYKFHYPLKNDIKLGVQVGYNTLLAHALSVKEFRRLKLKGEIGIILNLTPTYPKTDSDIDAAILCDSIFNRSFLDPCTIGSFPKLLVELLKKHKIMPEYSTNELEVIFSNPVDYLGVNYYVPRRVYSKVMDGKLSCPEDYFGYYINENGEFNEYRDNNEVWPEAVYDIAINLRNNYNNIKWYLAEIGIAMNLESEGDQIYGVINDEFRSNLLERHLIYLHKAMTENCNCFGVHMWTFIDCWSWLNSFKRRYGLYRLDLDSDERILKNNAKWFGRISKSNALHVLKEE